MGACLSISLTIFARRRGVSFLEECYGAEHTLSLDDVLDDLDKVCRRHEGALM